MLTSASPQVWSQKYRLAATEIGVMPIGAPVIVVGAMMTEVYGLRRKPTVVVPEVIASLISSDSYSVNSAFSAEPAATGAPIGVTPISVAVSRYFWLQTWGLALVNMDQAPVAGKRVITGILSAGNLDISSTSSADTTGANESSSYPQIGVAQTAGAGADKYHRVFLTVSP